MGRSFGPEMVKVISSPRPGLMLPLLPFLPMLPLRRPANMPANAATATTRFFLLCETGVLERALFVAKPAKLFGFSSDDAVYSLSLTFETGNSHPPALSAALRPP